MGTEQLDNFTLNFKFIYAKQLNNSFLSICYSGIQIVIIEIWQERNDIYMLAVHVVYGLGTIIGPLIAEPFLGYAL